MVPDAEVQILTRAPESLARRVSTNAEEGSLRRCSSGTYAVVVNKSGFSEAKASGIEVRVTETTKVTFAQARSGERKGGDLGAITECGNDQCGDRQSLGTETVRELRWRRRITSSC